MIAKKKILLKNILPLIVTCVAALIFFLSYNHYLLDKTLANLKISLRELEAADNLELARAVKDILDDTFIMEVAKEELDAASLAKMEFSGQIVETMTDMVQLQDATHFIRDTIQNKEKKRPALLNAFDNLVINIFGGRREDNLNQIRKEIEKAEREAERLQGMQLQEKYLEIAQLYMRLKEWNQALAYLSEIPGIDSRSTFAQKARLYQGVVYKLRGDYEEARRIFNEIKDELGGELGAFSYYEEGATLYRMGRFDEAVEVFEEAFQKDPTLEVNQIAQFRAGYIKMYDLKRVEKFEEIPPIEMKEVPEVVPPKVEEEKAVEAIKEVTRVAPETDLAAQMARIYMLRGFELARQGYQLLERDDVQRGRERFRLAREQFDFAADLDPKSGLSRSGRALTLYFLKDFKEALQEAKIAKKVSPDDAEVSANLGYIYARAAMIDKAIEEYRDAVKLVPNSYRFQYNLGTLYAIKEDYSKAAVYLAKAKQINPTLPQIYNNLGCVYWEDKKYNRAKQEFEKGLSMEKSYLEAHYNLAVVLYNLEQYEKAKKEFDWVKRAKPAYRKTKWYLDQIKKKLGD